MNDDQRRTHHASLDGFIVRPASRERRQAAAPASAPAHLPDRHAYRHSAQPAAPVHRSPLLQHPASAPAPKQSASKVAAGVPAQAETPSVYPRGLITGEPIIEPEQKRHRRRKGERSRKRALQSTTAGSHKKRPYWRRPVLMPVTVLAVLALLCGGWLGWKIYHNTSKVFGYKNPLQLFSVFKPVPLKSQNDRVNILLAGDSADRTDSAGGGDLTDSIMVLSVNTKTKAATMISVPRDTWVQMPNGGHAKINAANTLANFSQNGYPAGGMGALESVITTNLGIPIDYYALINYTAFKDMVDAVGGITVTIQSSDPRGLYDPSRNVSYGGGPLVKLANGPQALNGVQALGLARARGDAWGSYGFPQSDFDRTTHQRQMLVALKTKVATAGVISNPLKVGSLFDAIGNNIKTDMKLDEVESFYSLTKDINNNNIDSQNINTLIPGKTLLANYNTPEGQEALIPAAGVDDFSQIAAAIAKLLSNDPVVHEAPTVSVLNGGNIAGLASKEGTVLTGKNFSVAGVADAPKPYATTEIVDLSSGKKPASLAALKALFGGSTVVTSDPSIGSYTSDFVVMLGANQKAPITPSSSADVTATPTPTNSD